MRPEIKSYGNEHYEHVLLYAEDALVASDNFESMFRNEVEEKKYL